MNKSLLIILLSIFSFVAEAKEPTKGYRGFVELNMNFVPWTKRTCRFLPFSDFTPSTGKKVPFLLR